MFVRHLMILGCLALASPALSQTPEQKAQNASNWDVFQKLYPKRAIEAREEGAVGFKVTLDNKGDVVGCQVTHSSGHPLLDGETCKLITSNAVFKADPTLGPSQTKTSEGVINWKLPDGKAGTLAAPTAFAEGSAPEKVVCKKTPKTGSMASYERMCMTPSEWAKYSAQSRAEFEELQGKKGSTSGN
jgi:TonB family protein